MRKFRSDSGSWVRARLEVGSNVMSWSRNCPRNVIPAVRRGLSGLAALRVGSTISANGSAVGLSLVSMMPPGLPSSTRAARTVGVSAANPGSVGKSRPNRPWS